MSMLARPFSRITRFTFVLILLSSAPIAGASCPPPPSFGVTLRVLDCCEPATCDPSMLELNLLELEGEQYECEREAVWSAVKTRNEPGLVLLGDIVSSELIDPGWGFTPPELPPVLEHRPGEPTKVFIEQLQSCDEIEVGRTYKLRLHWACCDVICDHSLPCAFTYLVAYMDHEQ
jgi:hypothetical protein